MKITLLLLPVALLSGCYLSKTKDDLPWTPEDVSKIQVGKTTKAEMLALLGPPREIVKLLDSEAFRYYHSIEKETGVFALVLNTRRTDQQFDAITVIVNREGTVTGIGSRFDAEEASYGFPWND